jgi:ribosomal protein S18 acetylase RimI-like enzyme
MRARASVQYNRRMSAHVLDRPVWSALTTRQVSFAIGGAHARRFVPEVGPFAATRDHSAESLAALATLAPAGELLLFLQADPIVLPDELVAETTADGVQMVAERFDVAPAMDGIEPLTTADGPAMLELATLTKPGPFSARTHELGDFWGVKASGRLIAMAGERMKQDGFTEVSGVCTHPDARGRGLARQLSTAVAARIAARGETPYLHAYASNTAAIQLYESLGFRLRCAVNVALVRRRV